MTREECLAKIPAKMHATADALHAAYSLDWARLFAFLARVLPELIDIFVKQHPVMMKSADHKCDADLESALCAAECAAEDGLIQAGRLLCAVQCAKHAAGCCED